MIIGTLQGALGINAVLLVMQCLNNVLRSMMQRMIGTVGSVLTGQ